MGFTDDDLSDTFDVTGGTCYHCGKMLWYNHYGKEDSLWGWCVDHGNPTSRGGANDLRNWKPSCYECNSEKSDKTTSEYGRRATRPRFFPWS